MRRSSRLILLLLGALPLAALAALPQRTFVASNGVDTNPCSLVAPCRTFDTAIGAVNAGGEVINNQGVSDGIAFLQGSSLHIEN